jgi:hypothetical protein
VREIVRASPSGLISLARISIVIVVSSVPLAKSLIAVIPSFTGKTSISTTAVAVLPLYAVIS